MATSLLGDMGAEVLHVEAIQRVAQSRGTLHPVPGTAGYPGGEPGNRPWDRIAGFAAVNRNKKGITLDLGRPEGIALFLRLVRLSDVVLDNYAGGTLERMGLGYSVLRGANPSIIQLSMSGWGSNGPYRGSISFGSHPDAMIGHTYLRSYPDAGPALTTSIVHSDAVSSCMGAFAVAAALKYRLRTGKGQFIDLAQSEAFMPQLGEYVLEYTMNGRVTQPIGNRHPSMAPHGVFPCAGEDRWIAIAVEDDAQFSGLCRAMGRPELVEDSRWKTLLDRYRHQDELEAAVREWTASRDRCELLDLLQRAGVPSGVVQDDADLYADRHLHERGLFQEVSHREAGTHPYPGPNWRMDGEMPPIRLPHPCLGEHNAEVYQELLGLSDPEYQELVESELIGDTYLEGAELDPRDRPSTSPGPGLPGA